MLIFEIKSVFAIKTNFDNKVLAKNYLKHENLSFL